MAKERVTFSTRRFLVGRAGPFPRIVFREQVMQALDRYSHMHSIGEQGGFLIGQKQELKSAEQYEVIIERFVPIPQRSGASRLVITQEHYDNVQRALERSGEGEEIVGWAHTHPGFGVFLSNFDKEQHERYFPEPWQIAYVMDNLSAERVVYRVDNGQWKRLPGYYILRDFAENEIGITAPRSTGPWLRTVLAVVLLGLLIVGGTYGYTVVRDLYFSPGPAKVAEETTAQNVQPSPPTPQAQQVPPPQQTQQTQQAQQTSQAQMPSAQTQQDNQANAPAAQAVTAPPAEPRYMEYVVKRGNSLWSIARDLWGDPSLYQVIVEENDLANPSMLSVGMVLRVPVDPRNND